MMITAYEIWRINKMNTIEITEVKVPFKVKTVDGQEIVKIEFTLTDLEKLSLEELNDKFSEFIQGSYNTVKKMNEGMEEERKKQEKPEQLINPVPPVIAWDVRAINEKAATYNCKKCGAMMVPKHDVSKNDNPYLVIECPDKDCKSSFFLSWVNFVKNVKEILAWKPEWTPKNYEPIPEAVKLTIDEIATISDKTVAEIKTLAVKKRESFDFSHGFV